MKAALPMPANQRCWGASLVEMLVATCLLGLGMMTTAAMYAQSTNVLANSIYRQRAMRLSADLAELLHGISPATLVDVMPAPQDCSSAACNQQHLLQQVLHHWHNRIARALPLGSGHYQVTTADGLTAVAIKLTWSSSDGTTMQHQREIELSD